jgi:hypothetical protein
MAFGFLADIHEDAISICPHYNAFYNVAPADRFDGSHGIKKLAHALFLGLEEIIHILAIGVQELVHVFVHALLLEIVAFFYVHFTAFPSGVRTFSL